MKRSKNWKIPCRVKMEHLLCRVDGYSETDRSLGVAGGTATSKPSRGSHARTGARRGNSPAVNPRRGNSPAVSPVTWTRRSKFKRFERIRTAALTALGALARRMRM